jgi:hypothetical protein
MNGGKLMVSEGSENNWVFVPIPIDPFHEICNQPRDGKRFRWFMLGARNNHTNIPIGSRSKFRLIANEQLV